MTWEEITLKTLALVAEYDDRFQGLDDDQITAKQAAWMLQIKRATLGLTDLLEGVRRAYSEPRRPTNPVGTVIEEAKTARKIRTSGNRLKELQASKPHGSPYGEPINSAYEHDRAGYLTCTTCGAQPGEACHDNGKTKKIPHSTRLGLAYRTHNTEGRRKHEERQAHLEQHRKSYKAPWLTHFG